MLFLAPIGFIRLKAIFKSNVFGDLIKKLHYKVNTELLNARGEPLTFEEACKCSLDVFYWAVRETYLGRFNYIPLFVEGNEVYARWTGEEASQCIYLGQLSDRWFTS